VDAYLATLDHPESTGTQRTYAAALRPLAKKFSPDADVAALDPEAVAAWFRVTWGTAAPATWNIRRAALCSAAGYWQDRGWLGADFAGLIERRKPRQDHSRALSRAEVERLLTREDIGLRERTLWRILYETAARSAEILSLDVEDLDLPNRCAKVRRKGGAIDVVVWQTGTARLLPRLLKGRKSGPVFVTERKARVQLPPTDIDPASGKARLSYRQAEDLFKDATGGATLHQLRHSALTHDAEDGTGTPMLKARSGHTSVRSLARYARVSAEALQRHQVERDPARRRNHLHGASIEHYVHLRLVSAELIQ
jgi:integrase/recombinase XerC/integrase/recombinase XerD